jgi:DNA polymerase I-like protein with 3'-5' exonuclease and polymerase domains
VLARFVLPTFTPAFILHRPGIQPTVVSDFLLAKLVIEDRPNLVEVTHETLYTLDQVEAFFERIRHIRDVVVDLETTGLSWENDVIRCIGVNYGRGNADSAVIGVTSFRQDGTEAALKPLVKDWLESGRHWFIGQNRKFDTHFLRQWCGVEELKMAWDDTLIMAYLFNEDTTKGLKSLEALATIYCAMEANDKEKFLGDRLKLKLKKQADFWQVVSDEVLWLYCAADCWVTRRVRDALMDRLERAPALMALYRTHYLPLQRAIIEAERVGFHIDLSRAEAVNHGLLREGEHDGATTGGSRRPVVRYEAARDIGSP